MRDVALGILTLVFLAAAAGKAIDPESSIAFFESLRRSHLSWLSVRADALVLLLILLEVALASAMWIERLRTFAFVAMGVFLTIATVLLVLPQSNGAGCGCGTVIDFADTEFGNNPNILRNALLLLLIGTVMCGRPVSASIKESKESYDEQDP